MVDTTGWSEMKKLKQRMLRRAFDENRGPQMILLIQWRAALTRHLAQKDVETLAKFEEKNAGQPRAIRALNMIEEINGSNTYYKDSVTVDAEQKKPVPVRELFQMLVDQPMDTRILYRSGKPDLATMPAFSADHYDPMEGVRPVTGYQLACAAFEEFKQRAGDLTSVAAPADAAPRFMH